MVRESGKEDCQGAARWLATTARLDLSGDGLTDLTPLAVCKEIEYLDLSGNHIRDLSALMFASRLTYLDLSLNHGVSLEHLPQWPELKTLVLGPGQKVSMAEVPTRGEEAASGSYAHQGFPGSGEDLGLSVRSILQLSHYARIAKMRHYSYTPSQIRRISEVLGMKPTGAEVLAH